MRHTITSHLREHTARYWAGFTHARGELDVGRVHAFQSLLRERDAATLTDDEVTAAYGGRGWAPAPACWECGGRDDANVTFGAPANSGELFALCAQCIDAAKALSAPAVAVAPLTPKRSLFSRLTGG